MWNKIANNKRILWTAIYMASVIITLFFLPVRDLETAHLCVVTPECNMVAVLGMNLVSLPAGFLWILLINVAFYAFNIVIVGDGMVASLIIISAGCYILGYIQWFIVVPAIAKYCKKKLMRI